jgi:hypothetical protein
METCSIVFVGSSKVLLVVALALTLSAQTKREFQKGELLSITSGKGLDENATHRWAIFTVQIGDVIYTASGKRIRHPRDDYSEGLNAGDKVQGAVSGFELLLIKPDGGELKTKIVKRERVQP